MIPMMLFLGCAPEIAEITGSTMGTAYSVKLSAENLQIASLKKIVEQKLSEANAIFSTYNPDSEVSRINRAPAMAWLAISPRFEMLLSKAINLSRATDGAYDITAGPLVNLWGFGPNKHGLKPTNEQIKVTLESVGYQHLLVRQGRLYKNRQDLYLDFSSIAKGDAVDMIFDELAAAGVTEFMIEIGGEIRVRGKNAGWKIGIEKPVALSAPGTSLQRIVNLQDTAMATSGDYRNFFEADGVKYSHTLNPRTGWPVQNSRASVSVIAGTCAQADAYATAFMVAKMETIEALSNQEKLDYLMVLRKANGQLEEKSSRSFKKWLN
jgi:FAD:protein FMN transferase